MTASKPLAALLAVTTAVLAWAYLAERRENARLRARAAPSEAAERPPVVVYVPVREAVAPSAVVATSATDAPPVPAASAAPPTSFDDGEILVLLGNRLDADGPDQSGGKNRAELTRAFRDPVAATSALQSLECRKTLCKMVVRFPDVRTSRNVMHAFFGFAQEPLVHLGGFLVPERRTMPDGSIVATIFVATAEHGHVDVR